MKNRPLTISLLVAVVSIWAWIMYSVFDYMESPEVAVTNKRKFVSVIKEDTTTTDYVLDLNYKDPFLKKECTAYRVVNTAIHVNTINKQVDNTGSPNRLKTKPDKEEIPVPVINYVGRIQNAKLKKPVAILLIDGNEYMMQEGQENNGVLLQGIMNDSVKVIFSKKIFYVKKQ